ncbi:hypothetical protein KR222_003604, partial [Zaprionus bogoriensis]
MDNFCVPKKINRQVLRALSILQSKGTHSAFVPVDDIIKQVELQMRRRKKVECMEYYVHRSLCSLTHLGVLVRSGSSDYALRQALKFPGGVSA